MADKKISELPLITTISGSIVYVPIVHDGITEKITVEDFSKFTNKYAAQTGSANTFTANQTITANLSVSGTSTLIGNTSVGGNLVVNGKLTAQEVHTEITSASIIFESGSTIFGNSADDTHQFTGVVSINGISIGAGVINDFTASQLENDVRMLYITGALNSFTQSQIGKDGTLAEVTSSLRYFYQTTSSLHAFTASQIGKDGTLAVVTSSLNEFTASQLGQVNTIAIFTSSINTFTGSQIGKDGTLAEVTSSLIYFYETTSSLHAFTASQIGKDGTLGLVTSSLNDFTQSQIGKDFTLSIVTSSLNNYTSSILGQSNTIAVFTSSINAFTGSQLGKDLTLSIVTSSIDAHILKQATQTGSQDLVNYQNSIITSSYRIELNTIEAYTASLKSAIIVNGSNVQIVGDLDVARLNVQYVSSSVLVTSGSNVFGDATNDKHEFTGSVNIKDTLFVSGQAIGLGELNAFTGSQIGKDFTLSVVTSSIDAHILKQATQTGSQDLINFNISVVTSSIDSHILKQSTQTGSQDLVNYNISVVTSSIDAHILKQSTQTGSQDLVNLGISTYTGSQNTINNSVDIHILKQATQTGSQDLVNLGISTYTGSNELWKDGIRGEVSGLEAYTASLKSAIVVSGTNVEVLGTLTAQEIYTTYVTSSVMYQSGSTKFGDSIDDSHQITGSMLVTGSATIIGNMGIGGTSVSYQNYRYLTLTGNSTTQGGNLYLKTNDASYYGELFVDNSGTTLSSSDNTKITTPKGLEYTVRNTNGASGDHIFKSYNTNILKLDGSSNKSSFNGAVDITGSVKTQTSVADYAASFTNINDGSQGILVRTTDNDTTQYIARLQSSPTSVSEAYVDRLTLTKDGTLTASGSVKVQNDITVGNSKQLTNNLGIGAGVTTTIVSLPNLGSSVSLVMVAGDNGSYGFTDLVVAGFTTAVVMNSTTVYGSPPSRTYSRVNNDLQLNISTATTLRVAVLAGLLT